MCGRVENKFYEDNYTTYTECDCYEDYGYQENVNDELEEYIDLNTYLKIINRTKNHKNLVILKNYKLNKQKTYKHLNKIQIY